MKLNPQVARRKLGRQPRVHRDRLDRLRQSVRKLTNEQLMIEAQAVKREKDVRIYVGEMVSRSLIDT